ncbi:lycopene cyclase domain-containing protein [Halomarina pelagica]|uniref:lycopene cyclase domain-containing protein n=1 Tax=Halomarina pelagica TaxID=2961599 RepID=UPI0020C33A8F|nr:lycopene cyclase domain-containing protein [Halomarina sp. BND7]
MVDLAVFGSYTYLVTELLWGVVALALVRYAGAWRAAARTTLVLYPFAYLWDWYTLRVGVFAIPLRTGVEVLGIPVEEHVFMLLVPTMVVGTHESLRKAFDGDAADERPSADG